MKQTFKEYTEQRISDLQKLSEYFPEIYLGVNFDNLRDSYSYSGYLDKVKEKLDSLIGRELSWHEVDMFQSMIKGNIASKYDPQQMFGNPTIDNKVKYSMFISIKFNEAIGVTMTDDEMEKLTLAHINVFKNMSEINPNPVGEDK